MQTHGKPGFNRIYINGKHDLTIRAFTNPGTGQLDDVIIDGDANAAVKDAGIDVTSTCDNIQFFDLTVQDCKWAGIRSFADCTIERVTFDRNTHVGLFVGDAKATIKNCVFKKTRPLTAGTEDGTGCRLENADNSTITYCISSSNEADGFNIMSDTEDCTIENCVGKLNGRQGLLIIKQAKRITVNVCRFYRNDASGIQIENLCSDVIVRNTECYSNCIYRAFGKSGEAGIWVDCSDNVLIENCDSYENATGIKITGGTIGGHGQPSKNVIVRYNRVYNNNAQWVDLVLATDFRPNFNPELAAIALRDAEKIAIYHNTFWNNGRGPVVFPPAGAPGSQGGSEWGGFIVADADSNDISFINNILAKTIGEATNSAALASQVRLFDASQVVDMDNNIYDEPPHDTAYRIGNVLYSFNSYREEMVFGWGGLEYFSCECSPLIDTVGETWEPAANSPARNAAKWLATVTAIGSNYIVTDTPTWYFRKDDVLKFGDGSTAVVDSLQPNLIALKQGVSSSVVDLPVVLADWPYNSSGPDIGAVERVE